MALTAAIDLTVKKPDFKSMKSEIKELTIQAQQAVMEFGEFSRTQHLIQDLTRARRHCVPGIALGLLVALRAAQHAALSLALQVLRF